jgi:hypothetical protein
METLPDSDEEGDDHVVDKKEENELRHWVDVLQPDRSLPEVKDWLEGQEVNAKPIPVSQEDTTDYDEAMRIIGNILKAKVSILLCITNKRQNYDLHTDLIFVQTSFHPYGHHQALII